MLCLVLFIVPLSRAVRAVRSRRTSTDSGGVGSAASEQRMVFVGLKLLVVTSVCVCTTVLTLALLSSGLLGYMCAVDVIVNCACVMLMTAYYPDAMYYERLCFVCLLCCPSRYRNKAMHQNSKGSAIAISTVQSTTDTSMVGGDDAE